VNLVNLALGRLNFVACGFVIFSSKGVPRVHRVTGKARPAPNAQRAVERNKGLVDAMNGSLNQGVTGMVTTESNYQHEYHVIRGKTVNDLLFELEVLSSDQWQPMLYLGGGIVLLQRPFTGIEPVRDDELGDFNLSDEEPEDPLLTSIARKFGPHTRWNIE
jgi:hypothetical protein